MPMKKGCDTKSGNKKGGMKKMASKKRGGSMR